ncbi:MAG: hypothetical protein ACLTL2_00025 [Blautia sp.]|uniref:hypothetical protein n=1 Tax=Blautia sp. TaxID=1955243 RepID=UPI0015A35D70
MKKKIVTLLICGFTVFSLFGCTSTDSSKPDTSTSSDADDSKDEPSDTTANNKQTEPKGPDYESGTNPELLEGITYEVPKNWDKKISEDGKSIYYYPDSTGTIPVIVMITYRAVDFSATPADGVPDLLSQVADGLSSGEGVKDLTKTEATFNDVPSLTAKYVQTVNSADYDVVSNIIPVNQAGMLTYTYGIKQGTENTYQDDFDYIYEHIKVPAVPETTEATPEEATPEETAPKVSSYGPGVLKVGTDMPAGEYIVINSSGRSGYFSVNSDANGDDILFNDNFEYNSIITVNDGEYLELSSALAYPFDEWCSQNTLDTTKEGSMYKVGVNLPAGEYRLDATADRGGYYCIYPDSRQQDIISNDNFEGQAYVSVSDGQYLVLSNCIIGQ